ncbi:hypothetical protein SCP_0210100 [Sparassis crispa]|uniref:GATA-type domain-containing protein n=1 Tax=Sparassis crispa TaxID=139825 RepID=A0A401GCA6_9APHY|nr:hypothetical protein SCP_0210100 [Sparassis crispa]GBE79809.1 hypothetical protein SCP_0210100 [Sparassis crispa]
MDSLAFDSYTSYSDSSAPRTPSPRTSIASDDMQSFPSPPNYKHPLDVHIHRNIFDHSDEHGIAPETHTLEAAHMWSSPYPGSYAAPGSRGSLLEELYEPGIPDDSLQNDVYHHQSSDPTLHGTNWYHLTQAHPMSSMRHAHDVAMTRRATFPYVRQDRGESFYTPSPPFGGSDHDSITSSPYGSRPGTVYSEPLSIHGSPNLGMSESLHAHQLDEPFAHTVSMTNSPHPHFHDYHLDGIKTEEAAPVIVPSQTAYCRPTSAGMLPLPCLSPHAGLLVQHTDDAASKETQYLRRRCFNCHTTEPPSWRRSTLNPGKIVCNKCGLYERTHLRPRPLRFDELRAGHKSRKPPKVAGSPKQGKMTHMVKKEPREGEMEGMIPRRSSVSSLSSSVSGGTSSDWDDNVSVYSSGSAPPSSMGSPVPSGFSMSRDCNSQSPPLPRDGGIRLPNAPLSDIASLQSHQPLHPLSSPRKSATAPMPYIQSQVQSDFYTRRGSLPPPFDLQRSSIPEVTGWQSVPLADLAPAKSMKPRKAVIA